MTTGVTGVMERTAKVRGKLRREKSGRKSNVTGWPKRRSKLARLFLAAAARCGHS